MTTIVLNKLRLQNLRCFIDSGYIKLSDINILLGKNSCGKSTFLRVFPLLCQSINNRLRGPILWFDSNQVDFGSYSTAKCKHSEKTEGIILGFGFDSETSNRTYFNFWNRLYKFSNTFKHFNIEVELREDNKGTYIGRIIIYTENIEIILSAPQRYSEVHLNVNKQDFSSLSSNYMFSYKRLRGLFPDLERRAEEISENNIDSIYEELFKTIISKLQLICRKRNILHETFKKIIFRADINSLNDFHNYLKNQGYLKTIANQSKTWNSDNSTLIDLYNSYIAFYGLHLLEASNEIIYNFFDNTTYVGPSRASAERYYRTQDLAVSDLNPNGKNLVEYINYLEKEEYNSLCDFMKRTIQAFPKLNNEAGHRSIQICESHNNSDNGYNLTDVGFGYSQMLPVITKLWAASKPYTQDYFRNDQQRCVVIEQPELHLHPSAQAQIAQAILLSLKIAKNNDVKLNLIIETHSSVIINQIGKQIREIESLKDNFQVLLFNKKDGISNINISHYTNKGQLTEWPLGFFEP